MHLQVTVIVGQRNRTEQLRNLLYHLHPFMIRQQLRYRLGTSKPQMNVLFELRSCMPLFKSDEILFLSQDSCGGTGQRSGI